MNRLWVRFSVVFSLIALLGPVILASIGILTSQAGVLRLFIRNELTAPGSLADQLAEHYRRYGHWEGVTDLILSYDRSLPPDLTLVFMDEALRPLYGTAEQPFYDDVSARQLLLIMVDGRIRGYLDIVHSPVGNMTIRRNRPLVISQISHLLLVFALISASLAIMAGFILAQTLVTPLSQLAATVQRLGRRDFTAQAAVKGSRELRAVAESINAMAHDLEQAETLRRNLVADVAHELRTPLAVLQANLQALLDGVYPLEQGEIEKLMAQTELLNRLINDLRELSQAEAHQLLLHRTPVILNELIPQTVAAFQSTAKKRDIHIDVQMPGEIITIQADKGRLQQVLHNLLQNAITHTPAQQTIRIQLFREARQIAIAVQDTGDGIPAAHLAHVFDRFYRVDRSRSRETGGTGLGLAIAKAIVELHGGTIHVLSDGQPGHGTTFTLRLPEA
ncbi:MAG: ATP-binding protein [Anaerolineae bacterium]|nr:ATP-binding protein [Anaerolineae bacterium]